MNLDECLESYKKITLELIDKTKHGEDLEKLIKKRENVIKELGNLNFSKKEIKEKVDTLNIIELDRELQELVNLEKEKVKVQINNFKKARSLRESYNNSYENVRYFNAKI